MRLTKDQMKACNLSRSSFIRRFSKQCWHPTNLYYLHCFELRHGKIGEEEEAEAEKWVSKNRHKLVWSSWCGDGFRIWGLGFWSKDLCRLRSYRRIRLRSFAVLRCFHSDCIIFANDSFSPLVKDQIKGQTSHHLALYIGVVGNSSVHT